VKPSLKVVSVLGVMLLVTGCSAWPKAGNNGAFYTKVSSEPLRYGQACSSSILGLYASGDTSIAAARRNGSIDNVVTIEEQFKHVLLGSYAQYCVVVGGY